jgi:hypothetical protein
MNEIFKHYKILSLGCNCYARLYLTSLKILQETHFFDYIGSSMWAINELIENNFEDCVNMKFFKKLLIVEGKSMIINTKFYLRFPHDFKIPGKFYNNDVIREFQLKYKRRVERFERCLKNEQKIVFIRIEESRDRVKYEEYEDKMARREIEYVVEFVEILKRKYPGLWFKIIFISRVEETEMMDDVLVLHSDVVVEEKEMGELMERNREMVEIFLHDGFQEE